MSGMSFEKVVIILLVAWLGQKFVFPLLDNLIGRPLGLPAAR